jgi:hypothetical protein
VAVPTCGCPMLSCYAAHEAFVAVRGRTESSMWVPLASRCVPDPVGGCEIELVIIQFAWAAQCLWHNSRCSQSPMFLLCSPTQFTDHSIYIVVGSAAVVLISRSGQKSKAGCMMGSSHALLWVPSVPSAPNSSGMPQVWRYGADKPTWQANHPRPTTPGNALPWLWP